MRKSGQQHLITATLLAFIMNALLPFFALYNVQALANVPTDQQAVTAANAQALNDDRILICTAQGFKWVSLAELNSQDTPLQTHPQFQCALCYTAAQGLKFALPLQTPLVVPQPLPLIKLTMEPPPSSRPLQPAYGATNSRAPPSHLSSPSVLLTANY